MRGSTRSFRGAGSLAAALLAGGAALSASGTAQAFDGCNLHDLDGLAGAKSSVLFENDVTEAPYDWFGMSGFGAGDGAGWGTNLAGKANSVLLNAGLSDMQANLWMSHSVDIPDSSFDYGGSGLDYLGGVFGFRCTKGNSCMMNLGSYANKNKAWQCQRTFQNNLITIPLQQSHTWVNSQGQQTRGVLEEWRDQVTRLVREDNSIEGVSNVKAYVTYEMMAAFCKRLGSSAIQGGLDPAYCTDPNLMNGVQLVRLHWDANIDPRVGPGSNKICTAEAVLECAIPAFVPLCYYNITGKTPVCDTVVGTKHVVIDIWLAINVAEPESSMTPLFFDHFGARVSVTGGLFDSGSETVRQRVGDALRNSKLRDLLQTGIYDAIGKEYCAHPLAQSNPTERDFCATLPRDSAGKVSFVPAGARLLGARDPGNLWVDRAEFGFQVDRWPGPSWGYWPPTGVSTAGTRVGSPHILTVNWSRAVP